VPRRPEKALKESVVEARNEESEPVSLDGDDNREQKIIKYLGPAPLLYHENENDYNEIANLVRKQLIPTNILEEVWVKDYVDLLWELMRLRRYKSKLLCTTATDSVVRVISPLMFPRFAEARPLASGWASRTSAAVAEVDKLLEKAGLDREAIFAQILADKLDVIERIDLMIFRAEQRRNAALHEIERYRNGAAERMRQLQAQFEEGMHIRPLPRGAHSDPDRTS